MVISLAAPAVPVGHYATEAFGKAGVPVPDASREADVKAVVTRVSMGEADGGVVYVTDVAAGGDKVEAVAIPNAHNVTARYPIATLEDAPNPTGAQAFVAYVLSPPGQSVLKRAGFLAP
jgi:molybdate transport system substrate-binding protein